MKVAKAQLVTIPYLLPLALMVLEVRPAAAQQIYVANGGVASDNLSVVDGDPRSPTYNTVVATVSLDAPGCQIHVPKECSPAGIAITPDGTRAYVTDLNGGAVSVVSTATNTQVAAISFSTDPNASAGWEPWGVAVTPDGSFAYVVSFNLSSFGVSVIDVNPASPTYNTVVATVPGLEGSKFARSVAITPDGRFAYIPFGDVNGGSGGVAVISTKNNQLVATIPLGSGSFDVEGLAFTPHGDFVYVAGFGLGLLFEISTKTKTVVDTVTGLGRTFGVAITPDGRFVYVTDEQGGVVSVIRSTNDKVVAAVPAGIGPVGVAITSDGNSAYVTNAGSDTVSVIDTRSSTVITTIGVGNGPGGIAITP
jgi:YVTN family beta-propeller protein